jgi:hypothetical protein
VVVGQVKGPGPVSSHVKGPFDVEIGGVVTACQVWPPSSLRMTKSTESSEWDVARKQVLVVGHCRDAKPVTSPKTGRSGVKYALQVAPSSVVTVKP